MADVDVSKLEEIFRIVLDLPDGSDVADVRRMTMRKWDSLAHVSMVAAIESEFAVKIDTADSERLSSFQAARLLLEEKLA